MKNTKYIQSKDYRLIATAWHEASHAVCGLFRFFHVYHVDIKDSSELHGRTDYDIIFDAFKIENKILRKILLMFEIQTLYAGIVGEKIYYSNICGSDKFPMNLRIGSNEDIKLISKLIAKGKFTSAGAERRMFKQHLQEQTRKLLLNYWDDVRLIAHSLYRHKELKYRDLRYILCNNSPNKEFWKSRFKEIKRIYSRNTTLKESHIKTIII